MDRLQVARALVIPSIWYEGQPVVALEGLAAGTPLVLSDIGGLPEVLRGRDAGWLCAPSRIDALTRVLGELSNDIAVDQRGAHARGLYLDAYTPARRGSSCR